MRGDRLAGDPALRKIGRHAERFDHKAVVMRGGPDGGADGRYDQGAHRHQHDLQRAFHLVIEAAPAQMREFEGILLEKILLLQPGKLGLLAQIRARFRRRPAVHRNAQRRCISGPGRRRAFVFLSHEAPAFSRIPIFRMT